MADYNVDVSKKGRASIHGKLFSLDLRRLIMAEIVEQDENTATGLIPAGVSLHKIADKF